MTKRLEDLDPALQAKITALVESAPSLSDRQRQRLELIFRKSTQAGEADE